jgi:PAS domain S-box-containing protein
MPAPSSLVSERATAITQLFLFLRKAVMLNEFPCHALQIDERGIIQKYNESAVKSFGYSKEETMGQNIKMLMPPEMAEKHDGYLQRYKVFSLP